MSNPTGPTINDIVNLSDLGNFLKDALLKAMSNPGQTPKTLCLDPSLRAVLKTVLRKNDLQEALKPAGIRGIQSLVDDGNKERCVLYVVRSSMSLMKNLAVQIQKDAAAGRKVYVHMVPKKTIACQLMLEDYNVLKHLSAEDQFCDLELDLIPVESDFLTMEMDYCFREIALGGDYTCLKHIALSLMKFQAFFGYFPVIRGKGRFAEKVAENVQRMKTEIGSQIHSGVIPEVHQLYIFDRECDLMTPMLQQRTYSGILDEIYALESQMLKPPYEVSEDEALNEATFHLTEQDPIYRNLRGVHMTNLPDEIKTIVNNVKQQIDEKERVKQSKDITQTHMFAKKVKSIKEEKGLSAVHMSIFQEVQKWSNNQVNLNEMEAFMVDGIEKENVFAYLEECIYSAVPLTKVLRLVCIYSLLCGLNSQKYAFLRTLLVHNYGIQVLLTLDNLEKLGIIKPNTSNVVSGAGTAAMSMIRSVKNTFMPQRREHSDDEKKDISFAYGGWAPPLVKLAELVVMGKLQWNSMEGELQKYPGPTFGGNEEDKEDTSSSTRVVMLFFVGGITHSEISAIRFLKEQVQARDVEEGIETKLIIATTKIITGTSFIESLYGSLR
eukprot:TRINITY_DN2367_c1_g1_i2.p1 TRINITY_DN2367_c1_g1~~TRINITY_DN2367_c1_g1_i2.p1  ORF type:complete len:608 (+),score=101.22 TRINITY_DN2367_c1_g1_i2:121-1944(+)